MRRQPFIGKAIQFRRYASVALLTGMASGCGGDSGDINSRTVTGPPPAAPREIAFAFTGTAGTGAPCTGSYTFDPTSADTKADATLGEYAMPAPHRFELRVGSELVYSTTSGLTIRVRNNVGGVEDDYEVEPNQPATSDLHLIVRTRNLAAFQNGALPAAPPWGGSFGFWGVIEGDHAGRSYFCELTSLTRPT